MFLVVCAALAAWKVFDLTCLMVWYLCARRKSLTPQTTTRDNDNGPGKPAKTTMTQVDSEGRGAMTEGQMLDPREMIVAVFPEGARFHYRNCCVVKAKGRHARQLTACQICARCSH